MRRFLIMAMGGSFLCSQAQKYNGIEGTRVILIRLSVAPLTGGEQFNVDYGSVRVVDGTCDSITRSFIAQRNCVTPTKHPLFNKT
jgi:hypothetical protein